MPYGNVIAYRTGKRLTIEIELPDRGEPSDGGRAMNLIDPRAWINVDDESGHLGVKMTVCYPLWRNPRRR